MAKSRNFGDALFCRILMVASGPLIALFFFFTSSVEKGMTMVCGLLCVAFGVKLLLLPDCNYFTILTVAIYVFSTLFLLNRKYLDYPSA